MSNKSINIQYANHLPACRNGGLRIRTYLTKLQRAEVVQPGKLISFEAESLFLKPELKCRQTNTGKTLEAW